MKRRTVILIGAALAALYLVALNDHWAVKPDSGLYLGLGRSLADGEGMAFNGSQWWGIPPLLPALVAGCRLLVGDHLWLINLVLSLFGLGTVLLAYLSARRLAAELPAPLGDGVAIGVLVVVGLSARLFTDSTRILTDVPFAFFLTLGLYGWARSRGGHWAWTLLASAAVLVASWTRIVGPVFVVAMLAALVFDAARRADRPARLLAALGGAVLMAAGFGLWVVLLRSRAEAGSIDYLAPKNLGLFNILTASKWYEMGEDLLALPAALCSAITYQKAPWVNLVPTALAAIGAWRAAKCRQGYVILAPVLYIGFLTVLGRAIASRYLLPIMPILVYLVLLGVVTVAGWGRGARRDRAKADRARRVALAVTAGLLAAISVPRVARDLYWMRHPRFDEVFDHGRWQDLMAVGRRLRERGRPGVDTVLGPQLYLLHYTSGLLATTQVVHHGEPIYHLGDLAPGEFAEVAVEGGYRFVVVPMNEDGWSRPTAEALRAAGRFSDPPEQIGHLAIYERAAGGGSAGDTTPHGAAP